MNELRAAALVATVLLTAGSSGCAHERDNYVWANQVPESELDVPSGDGRYRLASGDVINVRVWGQDSLTTRVRVRDDGKISIPFLQDVDASGVAPDDLAGSLQKELRAFLVNPIVTVTLEERRRVRVSVIGEVARQGTLELEPGAGLLDALAAAGGLTDFAQRYGIFVLRQATSADRGGRPYRVRFRYDALASGTAPDAIFRLRTGDVVVVE
jgi:polysaccharide export outer membrane protein